MLKPRCAVIFGQFGAGADPLNLPAYAQRLENAGFEVVLIQHDDSLSAVKFLKGYGGFRSMTGSSLGAASVITNAKYINERIDFCGGFQPSDWDPQLHDVNINLYNTDGKLYDTIERAIDVPANVAEGLVFRNPNKLMTGGLGHGAWIASAPKLTKLVTIEREDVHPGDFGPAQDQMFAKTTELANAYKG